MARLELAFLIWMAASGGLRDREALRFAYSSEQGFDSSCGLSALSCLLGTYWGAEASEAELAEDCFGAKEEGDYTVSLSELLSLLRARGFAAAALKLSYAELERAAAAFPPVLAHYERPRGHFALVLTTAQGLVATADPAEGCVLLNRADFEARWSGYVILACGPDSGPDSAALAAAIGQCLGRRRLLEAAVGSRGLGRSQP